MDIDMEYKEFVFVTNSSLYQNEFDILPQGRAYSTPIFLMFQGLCPQCILYVNDSRCLRAIIYRTMNDVSFDYLTQKHQQRPYQHIQDMESYDSA